MDSLSVSTLENTIGAFFVGAVMSCTLFGVILVQTYTYFARFPKDRLIFKCLVAVICVCELAQCSLICYSTYTYFVSDYGKASALATLPLPLSIAVGFGGIIEPLVQGFFAYRVFVVSNKICIPTICWTLTTVRSALTFTAMAVAIKGDTIVDFYSRYQWLFSTLIGVSIVTDVFLSMSLFYRLRHQNSGQQSLLPSPPLIDKIIAWTVQSGLVSAITEITMFITFYALKNSYVWVAIYLSLSKIFSTSLLASLNGRMVLHENTFALRQTRHFANPITFPSTPIDLTDSVTNVEGLGTDKTGSQDGIQYVREDKKDTTLPEGLELSSQVK
ncbi:hypothetical protein CPB84DRAFT_1732384 [Gymnopilus junonius]|uniref:DUF6534 domain-containing protein n=1 Tax=Gymnopilus junonius TaxID=109634 RepID=A0A9P5TLF2_GYMJU|nr:hypothetical protein CPB84DRAFT_1732384 [Gymnopilus junonius]